MWCTSHKPSLSYQYSSNEHCSEFKNAVFFFFFQCKDQTKHRLRRELTFSIILLSMQHIEILMECKKKTLMQFSSSVCKNQCGRNSFCYTAVHLLQSYANVQKKKKNHTLVLTHERSWGHNLLLNCDWSTLKYIQILRRCKTCVQLHFSSFIISSFFLLHELDCFTLRQHKMLIRSYTSSCLWGLLSVTDWTVRRWSLWPVCCLCCVMVHFLDSTKVDSLCLIETDVSSG